MGIENTAVLPPVLEENGSSETQVLSEIVTWSASCPAWQRDALRRLCSKDKLEQDDLDDLLAICKDDLGSTPITADHIRDPAASNVDVSLSKLYNLQHVNALKSGETLTFRQSGLTVIYGENGSGKSGYARVLKQACRARLPNDDTVLPNIYAAQCGIPQAEIGFCIDGQNHSTVWRQKAAADSRLTAISVFDSATAAVHVGATNDLAYTPLPLRIMATLADTCKDIKGKLDAEIEVIKNQTPAILKNHECAPDTEVGKLLSNLSAQTTEAKVEELAGLSETDEARLKTLATDLTNDPENLARQLQVQKNKIDNAIECLNKLSEAVSEESIATLGQLHKTYTTARKAAVRVSTDMLSDEPLPEVGSDVWRSLWDAARTYSSEKAYPKREFPVTGDAARCVLCHQELSSESSERLSRFESFMLNKSKKKEDKTRNDYETARSDMLEASIPMKDIQTIVTLIRDDLADTELAFAVKRHAVKNAWRLRAILKMVGVEDAVIQTPKTTVPADAMAAHAQGLEHRATGLLAGADSPERKALIAKQSELADRQWLGTIKTDVLGQIKRLKLIVSLEKWQRTTSTNRITALSTDLATRLVTDRLRDRFAQEVAEFGLAKQHTIELKHAKTAAGIPLFHVHMISKLDKPIGKVLSEGEYRCVALAAFLAELSTLETSSGIVFDDPVSSLDHIYRDKVAERLATESLKRQVVIFTHDIGFLMQLEEACQKTEDRPKIAISYRLVSRGTDAAGFCRTDLPAYAQPVKKVAARLHNHLKNVKCHSVRGDHAKWEIEVGSFAKELREAWERAVAGTVAPVIERMKMKVETKGLICLTVLETDDYDIMREAYGRCSKLLHNQPVELNRPLPTPEEIKKEITALETWACSIRERQKQIESMRPL